MDVIILEAKGKTSKCREILNLNYQVLLKQGLEGVCEFQLADKPPLWGSPQSESQGSVPMG